MLISKGKRKRRQFETRKTEEDNNHITDRISEFPEFIIHHILSLLYSPIERVRMSVLSKKWFTLTASLPILDLDIRKFEKVTTESYIFFDKYFEHQYDDMTIAFFKYLDYTTSRFCNQNVTSAHTFKLVTELDFKVPHEVNIAHRCLEKILMKGVRVLVIDITNGEYAPGVSRYRVPNQLLSASSLTSLELHGCELSISSLVDVVKFKSLKQLYLDYVTLNDGMIKCLITGCPLLEELTVHNCYGFKKLYVYGLKNLQKVDLRYHPGLERIDIEDSSLCTLLLYSEHGRDVPLPCVNVTSCPKVTTLRYYANPFLTLKGFADLSSSFLFLEHLCLDLSKECSNLKLSSHSLKTLVLYSECDLDDIDINTPNLLLFNNSGYSQRFFHVAMNSVPSKTRMECRRPSASIDTLWFQKLRQFLGKYIGFKELNLEIEADLIDVEELKINDWSPFELERIRLKPTGIFFKLSVFLALVDAIIWCCRPQSLCLEPYFRIIEFKQWCQIVKFTYEKLLQQEDQDQINIRIVLSSSSKAKRHFSNLNSLLTALPLDGPRESITFIKEEVNKQTVSQEAISGNGSLQIGE